MGIACGVFALYIGALVDEVKTAKRVFAGFVITSLIGGLKLVGILFVPLLWPIFEARKRTKQRLAQQNMQPGGPASGGSAG